MQIVSTIKEMCSISEGVRTAGQIIALVPTMGYFHEGHLSLMREGRRRGDVLVVSLFINPAQFGEDEDYASYPRDFSKDKNIAEGIGVDILFVPTVEEMYPEGYQSFVEVETVTKPMEGQFRPTHFRGVTTVVAKLFNIVRPHSAIFGEKDFQQLVVIRRMVEDLNMGVEIIGMPIVRERDGLAMSSRNTYLTFEQRKAALNLNRSLQKASQFFRSGERNPKRIIEAAKEVIEREQDVTIEYVEVRDAKTLEEIEIIREEAVIALAMKVGKVRLIDNLVFRDP
ncbi:MAG: pantoate--beta-alanine ligase [Syntrophobacterales bacterium]|nr:MAG: pantoate--beta-alanine ligase [Syntrophobacterales bacterium]